MNELKADYELASNAFLDDLKVSFSQILLKFSFYFSKTRVSSDPYEISSAPFRTRIIFKVKLRKSIVHEPLSDNGKRKTKCFEAIKMFSA